MDVLQRRIIQLVDQNQLKYEDGPHYVELGCVFEDSILEDVAENYDFVQQDEQREVRCGLFGLLF